MNDVTSLSGCRAWRAPRNEAVQSATRLRRAGAEYGIRLRRRTPEGTDGGWGERV
jgi:hypothetical protein